MSLEVISSHFKIVKKITLSDNQVVKLDTGTSEFLHFGTKTGPGGHSNGIVSFKCKKHLDVFCKRFIIAIKYK